MTHPGVIIALAAAGVLVCLLGGLAVYFQRMYKRSQDLVRSLQVNPASGTGNEIVIGSPVTGEEDTTGVSLGAAFRMTPTVVKTDAWSPQRQKSDTSVGNAAGGSLRNAGQGD